MSRISSNGAQITSSEPSVTLRTPLIALQLRLDKETLQRERTLTIITAGRGLKTETTPAQSSNATHFECYACSDLAAEMAAASIVFKDSKTYSDKLVHGAKTLFKFGREQFIKKKFGREQRGRYSAGGSDASIFYNSTTYWDEFVWGGAWLYYATGNSSYLQLVTMPGLAKHAGAFWGGPDYGVFSWDNKLIGAQVLLSRLRLFLSPGYPYEEILRTFHNQSSLVMCSFLPMYTNQSSLVMCSFLPMYTSFNRTKGGLIQLNRGRPQPLQYVANAAFLASMFSDYL